MLKAIVVDDEAFILKGIREMVDWDRRGISLAGTAGSGQEGLELIESLRPDLVLTDIRMPGMDGLTMIRQAKNLIPHGVFIIFSGYNEFEYARQAISLGVVDYLEKPVTIETIDSALARAAELIGARGGQEGPEADEREARAVARLLETPVQTSAQLSEVFSGEGASLPPFSSGTVLALMRDEAGSLAPLAEAAIEEAERMGWKAAAAVRADEVLLALYTSGKADPEQAARRLARALQSGQGYPEDGFFAGVGSVCRSLSGLSACAEEARQALRYALFRECGEAVLFREVEYGALPASGRAGDGILYCLRAGDWEGAVEETGRYLDFLESCRLSPELYRHECLELAYLGLQAARESGEDYLLARRGEQILPYEELARRTSSREMRAWVTGFFKDLIGWSSAQREKGGHKAVIAARQYILQNYQKSITLQEISDYVGMNPTYLSMLFKEQTGTTYIKFLTSVRLERARELLDRGKKVSEVSSQCGFLSPRHFSEVFKKHVGMTPDQYRHSRG